MVSDKADKTRYYEYMNWKRKVLLIIGVITLGFTAWWLMLTPSTKRDWSLDQAILPRATVKGNLMTVENVRNFSYTSPSSYTPAYYDKTFNLDELERVWYVVEPFSGYKGAAHTFLSFEFTGDNFLAMSVEIRKEKGESFSALKGLLRQYELMYVVGDERDLIKLRSNYRKDSVYVYPVRTTKENARTLFFDMMTRMNALAEKPEFYNTLMSTCTTNIVQHVNKISPKRIPLRSEILFPAESDRLAYELELLDTELPFEEARTRFLINNRAEQYADDPNFSRKIRE